MHLSIRISTLSYIHTLGFPRGISTTYALYCAGPHVWGLALGAAQKVHGTENKKYGKKSTGTHRLGSVYGVLLDLTKHEVGKQFQ